jgi:predicted amidophosphoribosyltransferase
LLARALGSTLTFTIVPHLLRRVRDTVRQTKLNRDERQKKLGRPFALAEEVDLSGMEADDLVDDVANQGATLDACAEILLEAGAQMVNAFTLARAA